MYCVSTTALHLHSHTYKQADVVHILPSFSLQAALEKNDTIAQSILHMPSRTVPTLKVVLGCLTFAKCTVPPAPFKLSYSPPLPKALRFEQLQPSWPPRSWKTSATHGGLWLWPLCQREREGRREKKREGWKDTVSVCG